MPKGIPKNGTNKGWFKKGRENPTKGRRKYNYNCVNCGKWSASKDSRIKYCSRECYDENRPRKIGNDYIKFNGKKIHRAIWEEAYGHIPPEMIIHHKNGNKFDNRIENLEIMSMSEHAKLHWERGDIR